MTSVAIVAIAKNEGRYLREWIAYHLSIGISHVLLYDNESKDDTKSIIDSCRSERVTRLEWPSEDRHSPQRTAYADGLARTADCAWVCFIDLDEFLVPFAYENIGDYLNKVPADISALAINWKTFGDSNLLTPDYEFVTETFTGCGREQWPHNCHFKTIARPTAVSEMRIHHPVLRGGVLADSGFNAFNMVLEGRTPKVVYDGIQLNHYQVKTRSEFRERMMRGNANFPPGHPQHNREASISKYDSLNNNETRDERIAPFVPHMKALLKELWCC